MRVHAMALALAAAAACSAPESQPRVDSATATQAAQPPADDRAISHADALIEDLKRREAAQQDFDRHNPPPRPDPIVTRTPIVAATPPPAIAPTTQAPTEAPPPETRSDTRDEAWWRGRSQSLQEALASAQTQLAEAEKQNLKYGYDGAQAIYNQRVDAVTAARLALDQLHDEARRAGVPPAWLR
jgi:hypothetical protein